MDFKESLKKYSEAELSVTGFIDTEFGKATLVLLDSLAELSQNNPKVMKELCNIFPRLIDKMPISPITEEDFAEDPEGSEDVRSRCIRYYHIYKHVNGKYYNNRAKAFVREGDDLNNKMYTSKSVQEIILPYIPVEEVEIVPR